MATFSLKNDKGYMEYKSNDINDTSKNNIKN